MTTQTFNNAMRDAFINAKVSAAIIGTPLVASLVNALDSKAGVQRVGRGWTANIGKRTFLQLQKEGVFA
jgi:hypothetical protein